MMPGSRLSRRQTRKLAGAGGALLAIQLGKRRTVAQESDGSALSALGLPELNITITGSGYEGLCSQIDAGPYLVHAQNTGSADGIVSFMQPPEGMDAAAFAAMFGAGATPVAASDEASPVAEEASDGGPPQWFYTVYLAGGGAAGPGQTAHFVVNLTAGKYLVLGEDPTAPQRPLDLTVVDGAASPAAGSEPTADITIEERPTDERFAFELTGEVSTPPR